MTKRDQKPFAALMYALALNYGKKITKDMIRLFFASLESYTIHQIDSAAQWIIQNRGTDPKDRYFPTVSEIADRAKEYPPEPAPPLPQRKEITYGDDPYCTFDQYCQNHPEDKHLWQPIKDAIARLHSQPRKRQSDFTKIF